jgi:hypothetical protein
MHSLVFCSCNGKKCLSDISNFCTFVGLCNGKSTNIRVVESYPSMLLMKIYFGIIKSNC